jgi:two-component system, NarL family, sensor histidine kinase UhpB
MKKAILLALMFTVTSQILRAQDSYTDSLLSLLKTAKPDTNKVDLLRNIGVAYINQDPRQAIHYWKQGVALSYKLNYIKGLARNYINIGTGYSYLSKMDSTIIYADSGIKYSKIIGDPDRLALVYLNKADAYRNLAGFKEALLYCDTASMYAAKTGNTDRLARIYDITSGIYKSQTRYLDAMAVQQKALQLYIKDGNEIMEGQVYDDFGLIHQRMGKYDSALFYYMKAVAIGERIQDNNNLCTYNCSMAYLLAETGKLYEAEGYAKKALIYAKQQDSDNKLAATYNLLGLIYSKQEKFSEAVKMGEIAYEYALNDAMEQRQSVSAFLAETYETLGDFKNAYKYANISNSLQDSITKDRYNGEVASLQATFEMKEKDKEIILLEQEKQLQHQKLIRQRLQFGIIGLFLVLALVGTVLGLSRTKLKQRMKELELRNRIAADLHDEVGSSLSSIQMLSMMASNQSLGPKQTEILNRMSDNAKETMDKMGDIVWMIKPGEKEGDSLKQRMERFAYEICESKNIALNLRLDDMEKMTLNMEQRKNVYLIFKEALNNAIKYSETESIDILCTYQSKKMLLEIKDYGHGFDVQLIKRGNGLQNMQNRATELQAQIKIASIPGSSTSVKLMLQV